ncbi:MAG: aldose 1-epimerase family protein [Cyclobacteriaceae bacterium]
MIKHSIENDWLRATISEDGAELTSLIAKNTGMEYLWQADPSHWGRHAPILFPFVGKLKDNQYHYRGNTYQMGQHGFARDQRFTVVENTAISIKLTLKSSTESKRVYPFDFELTLAYTLSENSISVSYEVLKPSGEPLYFSIGGHPAFNCPLEAGKQRSDYHLKFNHTEDTEVYYLTDGLFAGATEPFRGDVLSLPENRFDRDALVFKSLQSKTISLIDNDNKTWLTFDFEGFPYLGIWSKSRTSPFVCIEPWFGIADQADHDGDIAKKEGIMKLDGKSRFACSYAIGIC